MPTCTTFRSLTINFATPTIPPIGGYLIKWKPVDSTSWTTVVPAPMTSPVIIGQVPACANIEGTVQANCGEGNYGLPTSFLVTGLGYPAAYSLVQTNTCSPGVGAGVFTLNGRTGDTVVLKLKANGAVSWDSIGAGGADVVVTVSGNALSNSANSINITAITSTPVSAEATISFIMPTDAVVLNTSVIIRNSNITSAMSGLLSVFTINGDASNVVATTCIGTSAGAI